MQDGCELDKNIGNGAECIDDGAIDLEFIRELELAMGDREFLAEVIKVYQADSPLRLASILDAVAGSNCSALVEAAHALKGSSANVGAKRLSSICAELERIGRDDEATRANRLIPNLLLEFDHAQSALKAIIES